MQSSMLLRCALVTVLSSRVASRGGPVGFLEPDLDVNQLLWGGDGPDLYSLLWSDINGDSAPDLMASSHGAGKIIFMNDGHGAFKRHDANLCNKKKKPVNLRGGEERETKPLIHLTDCTGEKGAAGLRDCGPEFTENPFSNESAESCFVWPFDGHGLVLADLDNNGLPELYQTMGGGQGNLDPIHTDVGYSGDATIDALFANNNGEFYGGRRGASVAGVTDEIARGHGATVADFNFDGLLDLLVVNWPMRRGKRLSSRIYMQSEGPERFQFENVGAQTGAPLGLDVHEWEEECDLDYTVHISLVAVVNDNKDSGGFSHIVASTLCYSFLHKWSHETGKFVTLGRRRLYNHLPCPMFFGDFDNNPDTVEVVTCDNNGEMGSVGIFESVEALFRHEGPIMRLESEPAGSAIVPMLAADFDNDGFIDIMAVESRGNLTESMWWYKPVTSRVIIFNGGIDKAGTATYKRGSVVPVDLESFGQRHQIGAFADFDRDGLPDVAISDGFRTHLWRNTANGTGAWVCVEPVGTQSNRDAIGALIKFRADGRTIRRDVAGPSYQGQDYNREICAGLGGASKVDSVEICWPNEQRRCETFTGLELRKLHVLREGTGETVLKAATTA